MDIESIMKQDKTYEKLIEKLVKRAKPDILVFEGSVSRRIVEIIRDSSCTLIMNVGKKEINRLSHLTQGDLIPSIEFLNEEFAKGTCKEFIIQDQMGGQKDVTKTNSNLQNLVIFKDCDPSLGCTVTFSGTDQQELSQIEKTFEKVLVACREHQLEMDFERKHFNSIINKTDESKESRESKGSKDSKKGNLHKTHNLPLARTDYVMQPVE